MVELDISNMAYILCTPVFDADALRSGSLVRFYQKRATTYPDRQCGPKSASDYIVESESETLPLSRLPHCRIPARFPFNSSRRAAVVLRRRVACCCNALIAAWIAIWPASQWDLQANRANIIAMEGLRDLISWTLRAYAGSGEEFTAKSLKSFSSWMRYHAATEQLHSRPDPLWRFPFSDEDGEVNPLLLFRGSIAASAYSTATLLRFSRFSRALPAGGAWAEESALRDHFNEMVSTPRVEPILCDLFYESARRVSAPMGRRSGSGSSESEEEGTRFSPLAGIEAPGFTLSTSSCFERSRSEGGAAEHIRSLLRSTFPDMDSRVITDDGRVVPHLLDPESGTIRRGGTIYASGGERFDLEYSAVPEEHLYLSRLCHAAAVESAFGYAEKGIVPPMRKKLPHHRVICVPDRGAYKVRVITAGEAALQSLAHQVRKVLYRSLLPTLPTRWALMEGGVRKFLEQLKRPEWRPKWLGPWVALSCDMKSATDRFPHVLMEAINDGLEVNLTSEQRTCANWFAWRSLSGPQTLHYDRTTIESTCGNLMGTAPSWTLLNIFNYTLFRTAWALWTCRSTRRKIVLLRPDSDGRSVLIQTDRQKDVLREQVLEALHFLPSREFGAYPHQLPRLHKLCALVGDDLAACCPYAVAVIYETLLGLSNGKASTGKHYIQSWRSGNYIVLAEEFAVINRSGKLRYLYAEFLRGIASQALSSDPTDVQVEWAQIGSSLSSSIKGCRPSTMKPLCSLAHLSLARWRLTLLKHALPVYIPTQLGGLGWPHPRGFEYGLERTSRRCFKAYSAIRGFKSDPVRFVCKIALLKSAWVKPGLSRAYADLSAELESHLRALPVSKNEDGSLAELTEENPVGLPSPGLDSLPFFFVLDEVIKACLSFRLVASREPPIGGREEARATVASCAKKYRALLGRIISSRKGHAYGLKSQSHYAEVFKEDVEFLDRFHLHCGRVLRETTPNIFEILKEKDSVFLDRNW